MLERVRHDLHMQIELARKHKERCCASLRKGLRWRASANPKNVGPSAARPGLCSSEPLCSPGFADVRQVLATSLARRFANANRARQRSWRTRSRINLFPCTLTSHPDRSRESFHLSTLIFHLSSLISNTCSMFPNGSR